MKPIPDAPTGTPQGESAVAATTPAPAPAGNGAAQPAGETQAGGQTAKAAEPSPSTTPTEPEPEELAAYTDEDLKAAYRALDPKIRAANQKVFTEKMQKLGDAGRLGEALMQDPQGFARKLAEKVGLPLTAEPTAAQATATETAKAITDRLAPFFAGDVNSARAFEAILKEAISESTKPLQDFHRQAIEENLVAQARAAESAFVSKHPDAVQHKQAMAEFLAKFPPSDDVDANESLEAAYMWATRNLRATASAQEQVERLAAAAAATAGNSTAAAGAAPIAPAPPRKFPTVAEAAAAALRGEQWS